MTPFLLSFFVDNVPV